MRVRVSPVSQRVATLCGDAGVIPPVGALPRRPGCRALSFMQTGPDHALVEDQEVLAWIGRFRFVTATLIAERFGVSVQKARRRIRRLEKEGFVARERSHLAEDYAVFLTGAGAARVDLPRRRTPRVHVQREHELAIAWLASRLERVDQAQVETERECRQREARRDGRRSVDVWMHRGERKDRRRWPDLAIQQDSRLIAIEIEFAPKGSQRLEGIVDAYVQCTNYDAVRFFLSDPALAARLAKIVERRVGQARGGFLGANLRLDITVAPWAGGTEAQRRAVSEAIERARARRY